jgi:hypothetical protein
LSLSSARPIQSTPPQPITKRSILISFTHLRLGLVNGLFSSGFPTVGAFHRNLPQVTHFDTDLGNRYFVTELGNLWEVPMEGSHTTNSLYSFRYFPIRATYSYIFCPSVLEIVGLRVPAGYIRNFRLFNSCSTCKNSPSARLASAANDISRDVDVFETRHVLRNYLS